MRNRPYSNPRLGRPVWLFHRSKLSKVYFMGSTGSGMLLLSTDSYQFHVPADTPLFESRNRLSSAITMAMRGNKRGIEVHGE